MFGLVGMDPLGKNPVTSRPAKRDGQLMLGLGGSHQRQRLPEPNRSQCVALLGQMLMDSIKDTNQTQKPKLL
jgi:hypothetical protein